MTPDHSDQSPLEPTPRQSGDDKDSSPPADSATDSKDGRDPHELSETNDPQEEDPQEEQKDNPEDHSSLSEEPGPEDSDPEDPGSGNRNSEGDHDSPSARKAVRRHLGRGLSALLGDDDQDYADLDKLKSSKTVPVEFLVPGQFQPRRNFDKSEIDGLAHSIKARGVLQPILARRHPEKVNNYEIIAGERRWRAAQIAGLHEVPVLVRDLDDGTALEIALVENLQRQNLNSIEEAAGYRRLMDEFNHTQQALSKTIGRSRSHIANTLRLLKLPETVQRMIETGALTAGHARAIATIPEPQKLAQKIINKNLSVRQAELLAQQIRDQEKSQPHKKPGPDSKKKPSNQGGVNKNTDTVALENEVSEALGLPVSIDHHLKGHGLVAVRYSSLEQLEMLLARLSRPGLHNDGMELPENPGSEKGSKAAPPGQSKEATFSIETRAAATKTGDKEE